MLESTTLLISSEKTRKRVCYQSMMGLPRSNRRISPCLHPPVIMPVFHSHPASYDSAMDIPRTFIVSPVANRQTLSRMLSDSTFTPTVSAHVCWPILRHLGTCVLPRVILLNPAALPLKGGVVVAAIFASRHFALSVPFRFTCVFRAPPGEITDSKHVVSAPLEQSTVRGCVSVSR